MSVMEGGDKDDPQAQIVAQVVQAGEAPPGGMSHFCYVQDIL